MRSKSLQRLRCITLLAGMLTTGWAGAESLQLSIEIPHLKVAEYHKPYVAVWLEDESRRATQLAVWYDLDMRNGEGKKWLKDLRQWWRRGGRSLEMPVDGITSATYGPGEHQLLLDLGREELAALTPGNYRLRVEAVREVGGRELVEIPLTWPLDKSALPLTARGKSELGAIRITLLP